MIPVTSCECERSVSELRRLKLYLQSTMSEDRLNGLALMSIHQYFQVVSDDVLDRFALCILQEDMKKRLQFARKCVRQPDEVWTRGISFYLDGTG